MFKRVVAIAIAFVGVLIAGLLVSLALPSRPAPEPMPGRTTVTETPRVATRLATTSAAITTVTPVKAPVIPTPTADEAKQASDLLQQGVRQQYSGDDAAIATFQTILDRFPRSASTVEARFRLAQSLADAGRDAEAVVALQAITQEQPQHELAGTAFFLAAGLQRRQGNLVAAVDLYEQYIEHEKSKDSLLSAYAYREIATMQADLVQPAAAIDSHKAALAAGIPVGYAQTERQSIAALATGLKDYDQALQWWSQFADNARSGSEQAQALYSSGLIQKQQGDQETAGSTFARLVQTYPETWYALQALDALTKDGKDVPVLQQAQVYFSNRRNPEAKAAYQRYLAQSPDDAGAGQARYRLAIIEQRLGNYEQAITAFNDVQRLYPDEAFSRDSWLESARTLARLDRKAEAAAFFEKVAAWYPNSSEAEQALWEGGMIYYRLGRVGDASRLLGRLRQDFPSAQLFSRAAFWEAKSLLADGKSEPAGQLLAMLAADTRPDYYTVRAAEIMSKPQALASALPSGTPVAGPTAMGPVAVSMEAERAELVTWMQGWAGENKATDVRSNVHVRRGLALWQARFDDEAATEFSLARGDLGNDAWALLALSEYMSDQGLPYQSLAAANRLLGKSSAAMLEAPRYLQRLIYPAAYDGIVRQASSEFGVDPLWLLALVRQESAFDRFAFSSADARGLTQVIPSTADYIAGRLGIQAFRQEDLFRPLLSLRFGAWYLSQSLKSTNGNMDMALAAYNGGLGNAQKWASNQVSLDDDLYVEDVTFSETQAYLRQVYLHHFMYDLLWGTHS